MLLAVTLLALTAVAVLGSSRQAGIVRAITAESHHTDTYQRTSYLAAVELALVQASLSEPEGEERAALVGVSARLMAALATARDDDHADQLTIVTRQHRRLQPAIDRYLSLLDRGKTTSAEKLLETRIEPASEEIRAALLHESREHEAETSASMVDAQNESGLLRLATLLTFLLGLAILAALGWSGRAHRRVIERMAAHDSLTGLPNRSAFHARADRAIGAAETIGRRPTVLVLDLDGFKDVNDSLGHHVGDLLLIEVGHRLQGCVRAQDTVGRLGGDEFAVLLTDAEPEAGERTAARINQALNSPFVIEGVTLDIEVSVGIVTAEPGQSVATVLRCADTAMYTAKEHRLGHIRFDPEQAHDTGSRIALLGALRRGLDADEFEMHYQPKISVDTGELIGAEALARWRHPTRGLVWPGEFIPVLEDTSLVHAFTSHVFRLALVQARAWLDSGRRIPVAVNVSTRSLLDPTFPETVAQALAGTGVPGDLFCIEITENTVMADPARAIDVLRRIRALGVKIAVDDFGTGYSSMAYLKILPVDEIKVDQSFVRDMATDNSSNSLVESAVDLAHNLGLPVVAEGVENSHTLQLLRELGCDIAQGYHFARPLPAADFTNYRPTQPRDHYLPGNLPH